jgi:hypothetical protein
MKTESRSTANSPSSQSKFMKQHECEDDEVTAGAGTESVIEHHGRFEEIPCMPSHSRYVESSCGHRRGFKRSLMPEKAIHHSRHESSVMRDPEEMEGSVHELGQSEAAMKQIFRRTEIACKGDVCEAVPARRGQSNSRNQKQSIAHSLGGNAIMLCAILFLAVQPNPTAAEPLRPLWAWDVSLTGALKGQEGAITQRPMPHYACTKDPSIPFCPGCLPYKGVECVRGQRGANCENCNELCEDFDMGAGKFTAKCLPRLQALEDEPSPLGVFLQHAISPPPTSGPLGSDADATVSKDVEAFTIYASVRWGNLDVFGLLKEVFRECPCGKTTNCICPPVITPNYGTIMYITTGNLLEEYRTVVVSGTFLQVQAAMRNMTFVPERLYNTLRVRHRQLSPTSTRLQPWFQIDHRIEYKLLFFASLVQRELNLELKEKYAPFLETAPFFSQLIHVIPRNNAPTVTDPQQGYVPGCITSPPCNTKFTIIEKEGPNYHFGQFWRWEGSSDPLMIPGINIDDGDVDEGCLFQEQKASLFKSDPLAYKCGKLDFNVRTALGTVALNMRDDLGFYDDQRSSIGFTATVRGMRSAVRALYYRVDSPDLIASKKSTVLQVNTQYIGAPEEFIFIRIADQGLTGADGIAQEARGSDGKPGLRINVTIAAVNNAPSLKTPTDFSANEDEVKDFAGLIVQDVDSNEASTSTLAYEKWIGKRWNQRFLNRVRITLELKGFSNNKGRGYLYLPITARDLYIVSNASQTFISIESLFPDHDACAFLPKIYRPGKTTCNAKSLPTLRDKICSSNSECSFVASGSALPGSTNISMIFFINTTDANIHYIGENYESLTFEVVNGTGTGFTTKIDGVKIVNQTGTWSLKFMMPGIPDETTQFVVRNLATGGTCDYIGTDLQKLCVFRDTTPELDQRWLSSCEDDPKKHDKPPCACRMQDTCKSDGKFLLFLNRSKPGHQEYLDELAATIADSMKTCGAMPLAKKNFPFNFSFGKPCTTNSSCQDDEFPKCVPGVSCKCCANISITCSANSDCSMYEAGSLCGCRPGIEPASAVKELGKRCCANLSATCDKDSECSEYFPGSKCGCLPGFPICGPYKPFFGSKEKDHPGYGQPCVYAGILQTKFDPVEAVEAVTMYRSNSCEAPMFAYDGTRNARIFNQLLFFNNEYETGTMGGRGSTRIEFYANLLYCQMALKELKYLTYNPLFPKYNRCDMYLCVYT